MYLLQDRNSRYSFPIVSDFPIIEIWKEEKNAERERVLPENFETKWNNADYKHEIEIYHAQKGFSILEVEFLEVI